MAQIADGGQTAPDGDLRRLREDGRRVCPNLSVVIPAYNEAPALTGVITDLRRALTPAEIVVVDDGSTDDTAAVARDAGVRLVRHDRCRGYGAALRSGTAAARGDFLLFCDGDGQHTAADALGLVDAWDGHDLVIGARGDDSHTPLARRPGKRVLRHFANYLAGERIPDINCGLRLVRKDLLRRYLHLMPSGFSFSTTTTFAFLKTHRRIGWVPVRVRRRVGSPSTVRQVRHGPQTLMLILRLAVLFEPLKVFLSVAGLLFLATVASLTIDLVLTRGGGIGDTTVVLSVATLIVFMFGLLCDQVSALRRELHE